jgi:SLBB domain-containing protein
MSQRARQPIYAAAPKYGGPYVAAPGGDVSDERQVHVAVGADDVAVGNAVLTEYDDAQFVSGVERVGLAVRRDGCVHRIAERLKQGYGREPHVSVEVEAYRPFFILGEVTTPGQYPYVANMTAETAIAIAGGFSPRGDRRKVQLSRNGSGQPIRGDVPLSLSAAPGRHHPGQGAVVLEHG